jgi:zinc finger SWIM domain-containing protein 3
MSLAIKNVLPNTTHRLCVWHMYQNAAKHLSHVFSGSTSFKKEFCHCVYDCDGVDDFQLTWNHMLNTYDLFNKKWLADLFKVQEKWTLVYGRQVFCANMKSIQRIESINNVIKKYLDPKKRLLDFFNHWERLLEDCRHAELVADSQASQDNLKFFFSDMLKQAASIYTPSVYKVFKTEYGRFLNCLIKDSGESENVHEYIVTNRSREHIVRQDLSSDNFTCTCLKFEFMGIQCCHVIKVMDFINIKKLSKKYFLKRWQKNAKYKRKIYIPHILRLGLKFTWKITIVY